MKLLVDFFPQPIDEDIDRIRPGIEAVVPHVRHDHRLREHLAGMQHQVLEQRELPWPKLDGDATALDTSRQAIEPQIGEGQFRRRLGDLSSPRERLYARKQLGKSEWLG